jgi:hypothetical protein
VVVSIGANDWFKQKGTVKALYHDLLDDLEVAHPTSHIMLYNSVGWDFTEPANYIQEVIAERANPNMSWAKFPWVFEKYHGCESEHSGMAHLLADHLSSVMGWAASPADVVNRFGVDGDVANGSFEAAAPFGGWGWRYFDDPGVARINDPGDAFLGDYYLQLANGATSHQTNPSFDEELIELSMWMRGESDRDVALLSARSR